MGDRRTSAAASTVAAPAGTSVPPRAAHEIEIVAHDEAWSRLVSRERLERAALRALCLAAPAGRPLAVTIALAADAAVHDLNRRFRGKDKPTNVLSFPAPPVGSDPSQIGDIVLARETIEREAAELGITPADHACHLCVHGVLHLLGHDHEDAAAASRMESLESEILRELGIADPYAETPVLPPVPHMRDSDENV